MAAKHTDVASGDGAVSPKVVRVEPDAMSLEIGAAFTDREHLRSPTGGGHPLSPMSNTSSDDASNRSMACHWSWTTAVSFALALVVGSVTSWGLQFLASNAEDAVITTAFQNAAHQRVLMIERAANDEARHVASLAKAFGSVSVTGAPEARHMTIAQAKHYIDGLSTEDLEGVTGWAWWPRVPADERVAFEERMAEEIVGTSLENTSTIIHAQGSRTPRPDGPEEFYPFLTGSVLPFPGSSPPVFLSDALSGGGRTDAALLARQTGNCTVAPPVTAARGTAVVLFCPSSEPGSSDYASQGYVTRIVLLVDLATTIEFQHNLHDVGMIVEDVSGDSPSLLTAAIAGETVPDEDLAAHLSDTMQLVESVHVLGRTWRITVFALPEFIDERSSDNPTVVLTLSIIMWVAAILVAAALVYLARVQAARTMRERMQTERERRVALRAEIIGAERSMGYACHELRNPLHVVTACTEAVASKISDGLDDPDILDLKRAAAQMHRLVNDTLDMSKLRSGRFVVTRSTCRVREIVRDAVEQYARAEAEFTWTADDSVPSLLHIDMLRVHQLLANGLSNAGKFTPRGGLVATRVSWSDDILTITVTDSGPGLGGADPESLFTAFSQGVFSPASAPSTGQAYDITVVRARAGTGLGLPICRQIARAMGGDVTISDAPGGAGGAMFKCTMRAPVPTTVNPPGAAGEFGAASPRPSPPLRLNSGAEVPTAGEPSPASTGRFGELPTGGLPRAIVVDDERSNRRIAKRYLQRMGFDVDTLEDGDQLIDALRAARSDGGQEVSLVLLDIVMQRSNGVQVMRSVVKAGFTVPTIAMTGNTAQQDVAVYRQSGFSGVVGKPFGEELLSRVVRSAVKTPGSPITSSSGAGASSETIEGDTGTPAPTEDGDGGAAAADDAAADDDA